ncbi:hypothetical protein ACM66B_006517 [Microbotryomycetes sp. NB124-2]
MSSGGSSLHQHDPVADASTFLKEMDRVNQLVKKRFDKLDALPTTSTPELIDEALASLPNTFSEDGIGLHETVNVLLEKVCPALSPGNVGPRYFGLVTGGVQPAAHLADSLVTSFDANVVLANPEESIATMIEVLSLNWLLDTFNLSRETFNQNTFTTGATASNILGLAMGRDAVINRIQTLRRGHSSWSVPEDGFGGVDVQVVVAGAHASVKKAAAIVGIGRNNVVDLTDHESELPCDFDLDKLEEALKRNYEQGRGSIVVMSAGEVNGGGWTSDADKIATLCKRYEAWFHIDAAFGAFALLATKFERYAGDLALADSITGDAHKCESLAVSRFQRGALLDARLPPGGSSRNVPYDCGIFFSRGPGLFNLCGPGTNAPAYLKASSFTGRTAFRSIDPYRSLPSPLFLNVENSRRFRALPVFASLLSIGRRGLSSLVERNLEFAGKIVEFMRQQHSGYDVLTPDSLTTPFVLMNVVLFRPSSVAPSRYQGQEGTQKLMQEINKTKLVYCTGTTWKGQDGIRFALSNWRTTVEKDWPVVKRVLEDVMRS